MNTPNSQASKPVDEGTSRKVAYNTAVQVGGRFLTSALGIITVGLTTRYLGLDLYGQLTIAVLYLSLFSTIADAGLTTIAVREIAQGKHAAHKVVSNVLVMRVALAGLLGAVAVGGSYLLYTGAERASLRQAVLILSLQLLLASIQSSVVAPLVAKLRNDLVVLGEVAGKLATIGGLVAVAAVGGSFGAVAGAYVGGTLVTCLLGVAFGVRQTPIRWSIDLSYWRYLAIISLPLAVANILNTLYFRADGFLLSLMRSPADVGLYGLAYKVVELTMAIPILFALTVFPLLAAAHQDHPKLHELTQRSTDVLGLLAAPITLGVIALAPEITRLLGGAGFEQAAVPLAILMAGNFFIFLSTPLSNTLVASNFQSTILKVTGMSLAVNIAINLFAIPAFGLVGAATAVACTEVAVWLALQYFYGKSIHRPPHHWLGLKSVLVAALMFAAMLATKPFMADALGSAVLLVAAQIVLGAGLFGALAFGLRLVRPADFQFLRRRGATA